MNNTIIAHRADDSISLFINGEHFSHVYDSIEDAREEFKYIMSVKADPTDESVEELTHRFSPKYKQQVIDLLEKNKNGDYFIKGVNYPLPTALMIRIKDQLEEGLPVHNLVNFFKWLCLNPDEHVRESLFRFMETFNMPITDMGYFIGYKSVVWAGQKEKVFAETICHAYISKKANNEDPKDVLIYQNITILEDGSIDPVVDSYFTLDSSTVDDVSEHLKELYVTTNRVEVSPYEYALLSEEDRDNLIEEDGCYYKEEEVDLAPNYLGNAEELFPKVNELFNKDENDFTDWHTRKSSIKLGTPSQLDRDKCDNDETVSCSSGLHVGAPGYVSKFGGSQSVILACLVNPMNVVAVPFDYEWQKLRCCEYLPYAICEFKEGKISEIETKYFEDDYSEIQLEELNSKLKDLPAEEDQDQVSILEDRIVLCNK